jgi:hypothetical protein
MVTSHLSVNRQASMVPKVGPQGTGVHAIETGIRRNAPASSRVRAVGSVVPDVCFPRCRLGPLGR